VARRLSPQSISFYNADDILLITPSVTGLEKLVHICENELQYDMTINYAKSSCMRIGPRCDINCANIVSLSGESIFELEKCDTLVFFLLAPECSLVRLILLNALFIVVIMQYLVKWEGLRPKRLFCN